MYNVVNVTETAQGESTALLNIANDIAEPRPCVPMDRARTSILVSLFQWPFQVYFREYRTMLGFKPGDAFVAA